MDQEFLTGQNFAMGFRATIGDKIWLAGGFFEPEFVDSETCNL